MARRYWLYVPHMIHSLISGAEYAFAGFQDIRKPSLLPFILVPLVINVALFAVGIYWLWGWFGSWMDQAMAALPEWLSWLSYVLWPLLALVIALVVFYGFSIVANFIASPFNGFLAERLENELRGGENASPPKALSEHLSNVGQLLINEVRKLIYQIAWAIPIVIISLIPAVNLIAPFLWIVYGAWMMAIQYVDYPMGNHDLFFRDEKRVLGQHRGLSLGFGGVMSLITLLPILNFVAVPVGVCGATRLWVDRLSRD